MAFKSPHLDLIRDTFPGRMVLGAAEVAVILGCSTKAVERMRDRGTDSLPLHWGSRGRRRVVSIVALANWLDGLCDPTLLESPHPQSSQQRKAKVKATSELNQQRESWVRRPSLLNSITALNRCFTSSTPNEFWTDVASGMIRTLIPDDVGYQIASIHFGSPQLPDLLAVAEGTSQKTWQGLADWWRPGDPVAEVISYLKLPGLSKDAG